MPVWILTLAADTAAEPTFLERLWAFVGVFHPATVHFPIALITFSAICIVARIAYRKIPLDVPFYCLCFGAMTAPAAAVMGWSFASWTGKGAWDAGMDAEVFWHRWSGVTVAVLALIVMAMAIRARISDHPSHHRWWQLGVLMLAGLVGWVGHQGGEMVHGAGIYTKPWGKPAEAKLSVDEVPLENGRVVFATHVAPILEQFCVKCHGPDKDKGDLRMYTRELLMTGGSDPEEFPIVVPGEPEASYMIELLTSTDEDEMMPPKKEGGPLKKEQIELIRAWIEQGAEWPDGLELKDASKG